MPVITPELHIPDRELLFTVSRSRGPGGQHVNKASTRVTLHFDLVRSPSLTSEQKKLLGNRLAQRIGQDGVLQLSCGRHRSQQANRREAVARFVALLRAGLQEAPPRRPTRPTRSSRERRLRKKKHRSRLKRQRQRKDWL